MAVSAAVPARLVLHLSGGPVCSLKPVVAVTQLMMRYYGPLTAAVAKSPALVLPLQVPCPLFGPEAASAVADQHRDQSLQKLVCWWLGLEAATAAADQSWYLSQKLTPALEAVTAVDAQD